MSSSKRHTRETDLALFAAGDLSLLRIPAVRWHLSRCSQCQERAQVYRRNRLLVSEMAGEIPTSLNWERLSAEMSANIRVGLAAGQCVAPPRRETDRFSGGTFPVAWRVATASLGVTVLMIAAWWVNTPARETQSFGHILRSIANRPFANTRFAGWEESGSVVRATAQGIELRENGSFIGVSQGTGRPVAVSLSVVGSARARYIDEDTGQVTITSVYAQ